MKKKPAIEAKPGTTIQNCTFEVKPAEFNEAACRAIEAIAEAVKANAAALKEAANALKGNAVDVGPMISITRDDYL